MSTSSADSQPAAGTDRLYGGWLEHKSAEKNVWTPVWCVLKRNGTMFFFTCQDTSLETHVGTLKLSSDSRFQNGPGSQKEGFKFDLFIHNKKKKFRVKKPYDRELWRAYMVGVITGTVPQDGTLSPQDMQVLLSKFQQLNGPTYPSSASPSATAVTSPPTADRRTSVPVPSTPTFGDSDGSLSSLGLQLEGSTQRRGSLGSLGSTSGTTSSGDGGFDPPGVRSLEGFSIGSSGGRRSQGGNSDSDSGVIDNSGGPFMHHKFDLFGNTNTPSWFFEDCNRELAEKILQECRAMGNTLMRVSTSARPTGSYAISKRLESAEKIQHYEVVRVAEGYKINAQNITNTMKTLGEVMDFFIKLSGPTTTWPMKTHDLKELGVEYDAYSRGPIVPPAPQEDALAARMEECSVFEQDNYEVPQEAPPPTRTASSSSSTSSTTSPGPSYPSVTAPPPPVLSTPAPPAPKLPFNTWGKEKTMEAASRRQQVPDTGGAVPKTVGPTDRQADHSKPSVLQVKKTWDEQQKAVDNLDAVLKVEEQRLHSKGAQDKPPPLPAVPADRPKLCSYPHTKSTPGGPFPGTDNGDPEGIEGHPRWNKRSQSVPVLGKELDAIVPAKVTPPSAIKPEGKVPPPIAPKTTHLPPGQPSSQPPGVDKGAVSALVSQLKEKFQRQDEPLESDEEYEDISQYYMNISST
ncbi:uncharacterized protein LOC143281986 isoform X2 [Babylonia areolata]|uniref:uncharacterized protein LOC143281986 isoform X2 n=1 Tax=Babylonia areolata TaxID=304850 RepID=UPI003FD5015C